jgi:ribosomal protein S17
MSKQPYRDYTRERLNESPARKAARNERTKMRNQLIRDGKRKVGDGVVVNHTKPLSKGGSTARSNISYHSDKASDKQGGNLQTKAQKGKRHPKRS